MSVKISIEGTFTDKPVISIDGFPVKYNSFSAGYLPEEKMEWKSEDGTMHSKVYKAETYFSFSLTDNVGQLEANVNYRVKANNDNEFVLETIAAACRDCKPGKPCEEHAEKKEEMKKPPVKADFNTYTFIKNFHNEVVEGIVKNVK